MIEYGDSKMEINLKGSSLNIRCIFYCMVTVIHQPSENCYHTYQNVTRNKQRVFVMAAE